MLLLQYQREPVRSRLGPCRGMAFRFWGSWEEGWGGGRQSGVYFKGYVQCLLNSHTNLTNHYTSVLSYLLLYLRPHRSRNVFLMHWTVLRIDGGVNSSSVRTDSAPTEGFQLGWIKLSPLIGPSSPGPRRINMSQVTIVPRGQQSQEDQFRRLKAEEWSQLFIELIGYKWFSLLWLYIYIYIFF